MQMYSMSNQSYLQVPILELEDKELEDKNNNKNNYDDKNNYTDYSNNESAIWSITMCLILTLIILYLAVISKTYYDGGTLKLV